MKGLAFAFDPDGCKNSFCALALSMISEISLILLETFFAFATDSVEIIKRGGIDFGDVKKE